MTLSPQVSAAWCEVFVGGVRAGQVMLDEAELTQAIAGASPADIASAILKMISNNIAQLAFLNARIHGVERIYFAGSFLRHNPISMGALSFAIDFWSKSKMKALFTRHEGYFGCIGSLLKHRNAWDLSQSSSASSSPRTDQIPPTPNHATPPCTIQPQPAKGSALSHDVACTSCGVYPIVGARFRCSVCRHVDLCEACESNQSHPETHALLKMRSPHCQRPRLLD
mmetsp:Transcript_34617/g.80954  ORF Transcript_34617/g.80954 Transcript_34617/m.80954 type:complete len:225 (+) Transcript_34617:780-1454(+)